MPSNKRFQINKPFIIVPLILLLSACASTPKQTVILSEELGNMIRESESSHFALVDEYVAQQRRDADKFLEEKWIPDFMKEFTANSGIEDELKKANSQEERAQVLREFAEDAAKQIYTRRKAIMDSIDQVKALLYARLQTHYDQMRITNETITAHLRANSKVTNTRDELLRQLKIPKQKILPLEKLNSSVDKITRFQGKIENIQADVDTIKAIFKGE